MSKQVRFTTAANCGLQLREPQDGQTESRRISGRPIVFGVRSVNLTPWSSTREVYEVLEPGCISDELLKRSDVVLNTNHDSSLQNVLGRFRNSDKDTLMLTLRADGVDCTADLPHTGTADDALELIKRGDIDGMSFAFEDDWEDSENGVSYERMRDEEGDGKKEIWVRHVKRITGLYDVAIVTHPAYEQTTVATREQSDRINEAIEAAIKREQQREDGDDDKDDEDNTGKGSDEGSDKSDKGSDNSDKSDNSDNSDNSDKGSDNSDNGETDEDKEREQKEREAVAVARMRRNRVRLAGREIDDIIY